jgi:hypothetical protein
MATDGTAVQVTKGPPEIGHAYFGPVATAQPGFHMEIITDAEG